MQDNTSSKPTFVERLRAARKAQHHDQTLGGEPGIWTGLNPLPFLAHLAVENVRFTYENEFAWLSEMFEKHVGTKPDFVLPETYLEKLFWRKVFDHNPLFAKLVDKLESKDFVKRLCPEVQIPEVFWSGTNPGDMPAQYLTGPYVIKTSHGWNQNYFAASDNKPRDEFDAQFRDWLAKPWGLDGFEWAYIDVARRMFVEEMLTEPDGRIARQEFKMHVFGGQLVSTRYVMDRLESYRGTFLDPEGRILPGPDYGQATLSEPPDRQLYLKARAAAETIGRDFDYIRVDLYGIANDIWFSELTLYPNAGLRPEGDPETMAVMADRFDLNLSWFCSARQRWPLNAYALGLRYLQSRRKRLKTARTSGAG